MVKKITSVNVDEELLKQAKREIPSISAFFESCLRKFLGADDDFNITTIQKELDKIKEANINIQLLSDIGEVEYQIDDEKLNKHWLKVWVPYRNDGVINAASLEKASNVLKFDELEELMETLVMYVDNERISLCDDWKFAKELYSQVGDL